MNSHKHNIATRKDKMTGLFFAFCLHCDLRTVLCKTRINAEKAFKDGRTFFRKTKG